MKYNEIVYICLDEIKNTTDDAFFTEEHIMFLADKYRSYILKQKYSDIKKYIPLSNYQTVCINLIEDSNYICGYDYYLRSDKQVPLLSGLGNTKVTPIDSLQGNIEYVTKDRMKNVGYNKYMQNIIYSTINEDKYLYLKSSNPQFKELKKVKLTGIFENPQEVFNMQCNDNTTCNLLDMEFPLESSLTPLVIESILKELLGVKYIPKDTLNNASDDIPVNEKK